MPRQTIEWQGYEYQFREKKSDWFWILGAIALAGSVAAILLDNLLFGVLIIIAAFTVALLASRRPDLKTFRLTERGLLIDDILYAWTSLECFWVDEENEVRGPRLFIDSKKILTPHMTIPLDEVSPVEVRDHMKKYLKEEEHTESLSHTLLELLGF